MSSGNVDRIRVELEKAAGTLPERFPGYREGLVAAAIECITTTAEHDDRKTNINQRFDGCLETLAKGLATLSPEAKP
jgi:hypothetical protein